MLILRSRQFPNESPSDRPRSGKSPYKYSVLAKRGPASGTGWLLRIRSRSCENSCFDRPNPQQEHPDCVLSCDWPVLDLCQRAGFRHLEDIEPINVAAYIEAHGGFPPTLPQPIAALPMPFLL